MEGFSFLQGACSQQGLEFMNVKNHGYCNGWCLFKELLYINVHMSIVIILIIHGGKRRVNREFFLKVLWGRVINLRNAEVRPLVLKSKCSTQGLRCVRDPNRYTPHCRQGGQPLVAPHFPSLSQTS